MMQYLQLINVTVKEEEKFLSFRKYEDTVDSLCILIICIFHRQSHFEGLQKDADKHATETLEERFVYYNVSNNICPISFYTLSSIALLSF